MANRWRLLCLVLGGLLFVETLMLLSGPEYVVSNINSGTRGLLSGLSGSLGAPQVEAILEASPLKLPWSTAKADNRTATARSESQLTEIQQALTERVYTLDAERRARLAYDTLEGDALDAQSQLIRETFVREAGLAPHARVVDAVSREPLDSGENYALERVRFMGAAGQTIEGLLAIPKDCTKCPVLIAPNGWSSSPEAVMGTIPPDYQEAFGQTFAKSGYIVFAVNLPAAPNDFARTAVAEAHTAYLANLAGERYWSRMRSEQILSALDFVETLPEADTERIAIYGVSMGGEAALQSSVADPRIAAVVIAGSNVLTPHLDMLLKVRRFVYPQMYEWNAVALPDVDEMLVGVYPRPVCVEWGKFDTTGDVTAAWGVAERAAGAYARGNVADRFEFVEHEQKTTTDGHETTVTACKAFIDRQFQHAGAGE